MAATKNTRNMGLDILRALAMFFVICLHILGQGGLLESAEMSSVGYYFLSFIQIAAYCAVDVYGITTGYLLCSKAFRLSRLVKLWMTTVFWSVAVSCCFFALVPESRTFAEMVSMFLPILRGRYWFFTAYFVVMLVSPVLNVVIHSLSRRQFLLLFAALFVIFGVVPVCSLGNDVMRIYGGNHFSWMVVLYLIGGYLKVHDLPDKGSKIYLRGFFLFAVIHCVYKFGISQIGFGNYGSLFLTCVSPLIVGEAICLFLFFRDICSGIAADGVVGKLVKFVSPGVYAVYVIHVHPKVFWSSEIIGWFRAWDNWNALQVFCAMVLTALAVFTACILLDALRQRLFRVLGIDRAAETLSDRIESCVRKHIC